MTMNTLLELKSSLKDITGIQWFFVLLALVWIGWSINYLWPESLPEASVSMPHDANCDLRAGPCISHLPDGAEVSFSIEPRSIPLLETLLLKVKVAGFAVEKVAVNLDGVDMYMGMNQVVLEPQGEGFYQGHADLSVCIRDVMEWEAKVLVYKKDEVIEVPYRFITVKNPAFN